MIETPMDVLTEYPVRKSRKQKQAFRDDVQAFIETLGYQSTVEKGSFGIRNVVIGDPDHAEYLVTAHYDTCARLPFPNLCTPCSFWAFLGYQLFTLLVMFAFVGVMSGLIYLATGFADPSWHLQNLLLWLFIGLMLYGPANKSNANDNTSGVVTVLEIAKHLPEDARSKVCFVLFDLEEGGLLGSASYYRKHKKVAKNQMVLNLDCVGEGNEILMFPKKAVKQNPEKLEKLRGICGTWGEKSVTLREEGFSVYPSDQENFPQGVAFAALRRKWGILCIDKIHTPKDTVLEEENVSILRNQLIALICGIAAE